MGKVGGSGGLTIEGRKGQMAGGKKRIDVE